MNTSIFGCGFSTVNLQDNINDTILWAWEKNGEFSTRSDYATMF